MRIKGHSQEQCRKILLAQYGFEVSKRTLQRWTSKLNNSSWDLRDKSKRPKTIHYKITPEIENKILGLRRKTGWGEDQLVHYVNLGHTTINKILRKHKLVSPSKRKKKRNKYIRFERDHPNTMWQIDHSD